MCRFISFFLFLAIAKAAISAEPLCIISMDGLAQKTRAFNESVASEYDVEIPKYSDASKEHIFKIRSEETQQFFAYYFTDGELHLVNGFIVAGKNVFNEIVSAAAKRRREGRYKNVETIIEDLGNDRFVVRTPSAAIVKLPVITRENGQIVQSTRTIRTNISDYYFAHHKGVVVWGAESILDCDLISLSRAARRARGKTLFISVVPENVAKRERASVLKALLLKSRMVLRQSDNETDLVFALRQLKGEAALRLLELTIEGLETAELAWELPNGDTPARLEIIVTVKRDSELAEFLRELRGRPAPASKTCLKNTAVDLLIRVGVPSLFKRLISEFADRPGQNFGQLLAHYSEIGRINIRAAIGGAIGMPQCVIETETIDGVFDVGAFGPFPIPGTPRQNTLVRFTFADEPMTGLAVNAEHDGRNLLRATIGHQAFSHTGEDWPVGASGIIADLQINLREWAASKEGSAERRILRAGELAFDHILDWRKPKFQLEGFAKPEQGAEPISFLGHVTTDGTYNARSTITTRGGKSIKWSTVIGADLYRMITARQISKMPKFPISVSN